MFSGKKAVRLVLGLTLGLAFFGCVGLPRRKPPLDAEFRRPQQLAHRPTVEPPAPPLRIADPPPPVIDTTPPTSDPKPEAPPVSAPKEPEAPPSPKPADPPKT